MSNTAHYRASLRRVLDWRVKPYIAAHRHSTPIRSIAACCARFLDAYHNVNCESSVNGEEFVLNAAATSGATCVFDVGANVGEWTQLARAAFPNAAIHCFELDGETCRTLGARFAADSGIIVNGYGLSNTSGEVSFKAYPAAPEWTSLFDYPHSAASVRKTGRVVTGDDYVAANGIERIDYLKIDVEGAERQVLEGFERTIARGVIDAIQFEYGRANILARQLLRDLYEFFQAYGYRVGKIYPNRVDFRPYTLADEDFRGLNYLAARESRTDLIARLS